MQGVSLPPVFFSFSHFVKMVCCSVPGCTNHSYSAPKGVSFHTFPMADPVRMMRKWLSTMRRDDFAPKSGSRLCSEYFTDDCFDKSLKTKMSVEVGHKCQPKRRLFPDAVPTIFPMCIIDSFQIWRPTHCKRPRPPCW